MIIDRQEIIVKMPHGSTLDQWHDIVTWRTELGIVRADLYSRWVVLESRYDLIFSNSEHAMLFRLRFGV